MRTIDERELQAIPKSWRRASFWYSRKLLTILVILVSRPSPVELSGRRRPLRTLSDPHLLCACCWLGCSTLAWVLTACPSARCWSSCALLAWVLAARSSARCQLGCSTLAWVLAAHCWLTTAISKSASKARDGVFEVAARHGSAVNQLHDGSRRAVYQHTRLVECQAMFAGVVVEAEHVEFLSQSNFLKGPEAIPSRSTNDKIHKFVSFPRANASPFQHDRICKSENLWRSLPSTRVSSLTSSRSTDERMYKQH